MAEHDTTITPPTPSASAPGPCSGPSRSTEAWDREHDQGCQFTSAEFTRPRLEAGIKLSMDGNGRCLDNVFVERLCRTVNYEDVYLMGYRSLVDALAQH